MCYDMLVMAAVTAAGVAESERQASAAATQQKRAQRQQKAEFDALLAEQQKAAEEPDEAVSMIGGAESLKMAQRILAMNKGGAVQTSPLGTQWVPGTKKTLLGA